MTNEEFIYRERRSQISRFYAIPLEWIPPLATLAVILIASTVLLGWYFGLPDLYSFLPGLPAMTPDSAIGMLFCGIALYLLSPTGDSPMRRRFGQAFALFCLLPALFNTAGSLYLIPESALDKLSPYLLSLESDLTGQSAHRNIAFFLGGLALFLLGFKKTGILITVQWLAAIILTIAIVILFSYIYSMTAYYGYTGVTSMALPSALGLAFLSNGILFARPHEGIMRLITSDAAGGIIMRRLLPIVIIAPLMIGWMMLAGQRIGLITPHFGLAMHEVLTALLITVFIIRIAVTLNREEWLRQTAEAGAKKHQSDLAHLVRVNTLGEMVANIAHELKQPLTAISLYAANSKEMLSSSDTEISQLRKMLDEIQNQSLHAAEIIRRTREFAHKREPQAGTVQLNDLITDIRDFLGTVARSSGVKIELELTPELPVIEGDATQLRQVLINIIHNAIECLQAKKNKPRRVTVQTCLTKTGEVSTVITDNGPGMSAETLSHIFESFFTTKGETGMGMGLSISRSIIEAHGGQLWARSTPGEGASFTFTLPAKK